MSRYNPAPVSGQYVKDLPADRFRNYVRTTSQENAIYLVGDSITEGTASTDWIDDSWAGIVRKAVQREYGNRNYGFVSFRDISGASPGPVTQYHALTFNGFNGTTFDGTYFGGIRCSSTTSGNSITITYTGKDAKLVFGQRADGGVINVTLDGVAQTAINTATSGTKLNSNANATVSSAIIPSTWGSHTIVLTKADASPTDLLGMMYYEDSTVTAPIVHNVGRSSINCTDIPTALFDVYTMGGAAVIALGVNDRANSTSVSTYQSNIKHCCDKMVANGGSLLLLDFMFGASENDPYKTALRNVAAAYPQFPLIDFAALWFDNVSSNQFANLQYSDGIHPTVAGHEFIANTVLRWLGIPLSKATTGDGYFYPATLGNGWANYGGGYNDAAYSKDDSGTVHLQGMIKSGTITSGTTLFTLPVGYRPKGKMNFVTTSNAAYGEIYIDSTGVVQILNGSNVYLSLEGISFRTQG